jgi:hypothetical protein
MTEQVGGYEFTFGGVVPVKRPPNYSGVAGHRRDCAKDGKLLATLAGR